MTAPHLILPTYRHTGVPPSTARFEPISHAIACSVGREIEKSDLIFTNDPGGANPGVLSTVGDAFSALQAKRQPGLSVAG